MRFRRVTQWLPYAVVRWWIRKMEPERGTLAVRNGPTTKGAFWEIFTNEVIFVGDRGVYLQKKAKLEAAVKNIEKQLERLDEEEAMK